MAYEDRSYSGSAVETTLTANITATTTAIPIALTTGWPDGASGPFHIAIAPANDPDSFSEVIRCTGRTGNTLNVQTTPVSGRGWDGTTPLAHITGAIVAHVVTATDLEEANQHITNTGLDHHSQYLTIARHDTSGRHGIANLPVGGTPSASVPGDTSFSGTSGLLPRSDHKHARESFGIPVPTGQTISAGSSTSLARADHVHTDTPVVCTSTTRPTSPYQGLTIIETDTRRILYWNISAWIRIGWTWYTGRTGATLTRSAFDIPSGGAGPTIIPWSGEPVDSDNFISTDGTTSTTFLITDAVYVGIYMVCVVGTWSAIFTQRAFVEIIHAGAPETRYRYTVTGEDRWAATAMLTMDPGDPAGIQVGVYQESGSVKQVTATVEIYRIGL